MHTYTRNIAINARPLVKTKQLPAEDRGVAGVYGVEVPVNVTDEEAATIALDVFHESIAVDTLDNFDFSVFDMRTGRALDEAEDAESYEHGGEGEFLGCLHDKPWVCYKVTLTKHSDIDEFYMYASDVASALRTVNATIGPVTDEDTSVEIIEASN